MFERREDIVDIFCNLKSGKIKFRGREEFKTQVTRNTALQKEGGWKSYCSIGESR